MTTQPRSPRLFVLALALSSCKVTDQSPSDPTANGAQSETVLAIQGSSGSDFNEIVLYNDDTNSPGTSNPPHVVYGSTARYVCVGASELGYSNLKNGDNAFSYTNVPPPSGISVLWGDPAIAWSPYTAPSGYSDVWISNLMIPSTKLPTGCKFGGLDSTVMGGAAIYHSADRGRTFTYKQPLSNGNHFYDGGTMAWNTAYVMAAYVDEDAVPEDIDVWYASSGGGSFSRAPNPFAGCSSCGSFQTHPGLRVDKNLVFYVMAVDSNGKLWVTRTWSLSPPYSWQTPVLVTPNIVATIGSSRSFANVLGQPASIRLGKGFDFAIGRNESGDLELRFVYTVNVYGVVYRVIGGKCTLGSSISGCTDVIQWNGHSVPGQPDYPGDQFNPLLAASHKGGLTPDVWAISYDSRQEDTTGNTVEFWQAQLIGGANPSAPKKKVVASQVVCPDLRGYWGDYDSLIYVGINNGEETFVRPYSDSTDGGGCVSSNPNAFRWTYRSGPLHVSMGQITIP
jgi:hypothetical protein